MLTQRTILLTVVALALGASAPCAATAQEPAPLIDSGTLVADITAGVRIAVAPTSGEVYVLDAAPGAPQVRRYSPQGALLGAWGSQGAAPGQFDAPTDLTVDAAGSVYVADEGNRRIEKFDAAGALLDAQWAAAEAFSLSAAADGSIVAAGSTAVTRYTPDGATLATSPSSPPNYIEAGPSGDVFFSTSGGIGRQGPDGRSYGIIAPIRADREPFELAVLTSRPGGLAVTLRGTLLAADPIGHRFMEFTNSGAFVQACGAHRFGQDFQPVDMASLADGSLYVLEANRVRRFTTGAAGQRCRDLPPRISQLTARRDSRGRIVVSARSNAPGAVGITLDVARTGGRVGGKCRASGYPRRARPCRFFRFAGGRDLAVSRAQPSLSTRFRSRPQVVRITASITDATGITGRRRITLPARPRR